MNEHDALRIIGDVLETSIEAQTTTTAAMTEVKILAQNQQAELKEIKGYFHNGLRSNIRGLLENNTKQLQEIETMQTSLADAMLATNALNEKIDKIINNLKKPMWWLKHILLAVIAVGGMSYGLVRVVELVVKAIAGWPV